ncbi:MAG: F-type H+-transporting ATPase subunit epsilon [Rhodospirillaceae bacterium]|nr:MAG: F-type H+-transporting ATPase subunit epsilon [Rhodospirillaceae bacterium]
MARMVNFDLVSPEKLLFSEQVEMVVVPGSEGDFGVLIDHAPLLSTIRPGVLAVYRNSQVVERIFVAGGFAEVTESTLTVLAEEAFVVDSLERTEVERRLAGARDMLQMADTPVTRAEAEVRIVVAEAMLAAIQ